MSSPTALAPFLIEEQPPLVDLDAMAIVRQRITRCRTRLAVGCAMLGMVIGGILIRLVQIAISLVQI